MSHTLDDGYEDRGRSVILPEARLASESAPSPRAAMAEEQASSPALVEELRDRPTLPMLG